MRCQAVCSDDLSRFCGHWATKVATTNQRVSYAYMVRVVHARIDPERTYQP